MPNRDTVQEIKEKLSVLDVVQPYVKMMRSGKYWKGHSPFNKEKTPSFFVSPDRGTYYCFSSGQGGDMFTFIEKMEGVDFRGALKILADKAGVSIQAYDGGIDHSFTERLRDAHARAGQFFVRTFTKETPAWKYALSRGLSEETISAWGIGYAPDQWRALLEELTTAGFSQKELLQSGLVKEADGKPGTFYDRFRNRLVFPIRDSAGRTVGFIGRALSESEPAKYLNSPETELFKKSEVLFGIDKAKDSIRTRGYVLLVEGQMDVVHCHQAGFTNAIAISGTALSSAHITLMKRYADNVVFMLDSDRAGLAATARAAKLALSSGMHVKAVALPEGKDPADILSQDTHDFPKHLSEAQSIVEFFLSTILRNEQNRHKQILATETIVIPLLSAIESPLERDHFIGVVANGLGISLDAVRKSLSNRATVAKGMDGVRTSQMEEKVFEGAPLSPVLARAEALCATVLNYPDSALSKRIKDEYLRIMNEPLGDTVSHHALFEVGIALGEQPSPDACDDLIRSFERSVLEEQYEDALAQLRIAQAQGDLDAQKKAEVICSQLLKRIATCT
ncbi:MAG TPA: DNA primase [Candidatus Kaiserbacteria bacterium]|nr:DNA primase [Candidatus Kaiserbacteria bacterium]